MHTNGGDPWLVIDALHDAEIYSSRSNLKAEEECALRNCGADWFCNKPRFYVKRWKEVEDVHRKCSNT